MFEDKHLMMFISLANEYHRNFKVVGVAYLETDGHG
jgi:hypothetical protein